MSEGVVERVEFLELRDRVLALEKTVAELAKWTHFNQQNIAENNGAADPVANVDGVAASENPGAGNVQNTANQEGNLRKEISAVRKAKSMAANHDQKKSGNPQGTSSDKTPPVATIPEAMSSAERQISSTGAEQRPKEKGVIPPRIKIEGGDVIYQCKLEEESDCDCSSEEDLNSSISSGSSKPTRKQNKRYPKKKSATATRKSPTVESKSAFVSLKRLSSVQILSIKRKMATRSKRQWKCPHCSKILSCKSSLTMHFRSHTGERPFRCPHCPTATTGASSLRLHIRTFHPNESKNLFFCKICQQKFPFQKTLMTHMGKHLKCYFCSHKVQHFYHMRAHLATHTGEKPFSCPNCRYATCAKGNLKKHEKIHNDV